VPSHIATHDAHGSYRRGDARATTAYRKSIGGRIPTDNPLERVLREIMRRARVVSESILDTPAVTCVGETMRLILVETATGQSQPLLCLHILN